MTAREPRSFTVYGFATTHDALAAESAIREAGVPVVAIPAPRELGSLCGIALRVEVSDAPRLEDALAEAGVRWTGRVAITDV